MFKDLIGVPSFDPKKADAHLGDPLFVRALARGVAILSAFEMARKPMTLNELATAAGMDRSAAQRMIHTLSLLGLIERAPDDRGYLPGNRLITLAYSALRLNPVVQRAAPILLELRRRTRERADMSLWDDLRLIYTVRMPSKHEIFTATLTGNTVPVYCTAGGIAVLSALPDAQIADIVARSDLTPFTPETYANLGDVMRRVTDARARGHSLVWGQLLRHEVVLGAPILSPEGQPIGAVHLAGNLTEHHPEAFSAAFGPMICAAARSISSSG